MSEDLDLLDDNSANNAIADIISNTKKKSSKKKDDRDITNKSYKYDVTSKQFEFLTFVKEDKREHLYEVMFSGGVGSGKSYALCLQLLKYVKVPNTKVLLLHQYLSMLLSTTFPLLMYETVGKDGELRPPLLRGEFIENYNKSTQEILLTNGSTILLKGCQNPDKLKGLNLVAAFIDELTNLKVEWYNSIVERCRVFNKNPNAIFSCTNPSSKNHWAYKRFFENKIQGYREGIIVDSRSNRENLTPAYIRYLEDLPDLERKKQLEGCWINSGNSVFYTFSRDSHVKYLEDWNKSDYDDFLVSNDFGGGGENAYSGACLIGRKDNIYYILEEFGKKKTTHKEMLDFLEQYRDISNECVVFDSANAALGSDLENAGWKTIKSIKDIEGSISKMNSLFKDNRIIISTKCSRLIAQLEGAVRNQDTDKINKLNDWDLIDACRYGICAFDNNELMDKNSSNSNVFVFTL